MDVAATSKYIRVSPRKLELLVRGIKSYPPTQALTQLEFIHESGARPLHKVIASALANAKNRNLKTDSLIFKQIEVTPGGALKRFRAVSRGMAHSYKKRMSHIRVTLTDADVKQGSQIKQMKTKLKEKNQNSKIKVESESVKMKNG